MPVQLGGLGGGYSPTSPLVPRKAVGTGNGLDSFGVPTQGKQITTPSLGTGQVSTGAANVTPMAPIDPSQEYQNELNAATSGAQGIYSSQLSNLASARADAIQRAVIGGGWAPSQFTGSLASYAGDVTPDTLAAAAANPMSQKAQLDLQNQQAMTNQPYDLAASGMGRSGAAAINSGNLQRQYQQASYSGMNDMLNSIYGAGNTYAQSANDALNQLQYARTMAAQQLQNQIGYSAAPDGSDTTAGQPAPAASAPSYPSVAGPGTPPPPITQTVQKVIASLGKSAASNPRAYQDARNIRMG